MALYVYYITVIGLKWSCSLNEIYSFQEHATPNNTYSTLIHSSRKNWILNKTFYVYIWSQDCYVVVLIGSNFVVLQIPLNLKFLFSVAF